MPALTEIFGDDSVLQFGGGSLGHPVFRNKEGRELFVRRMPTFFERPKIKL
jgi:hypothetical protein